MYKKRWVSREAKYSKKESWKHRRVQEHFDGEAEAWARPDAAAEASIEDRTDEGIVTIPEAGCVVDAATFGEADAD